MNKKALSPIVATVILIAFAIALGLVVMSWGKSYIEEKAEFVAGPSDISACGYVELDIIKVGGEERVCYNPAQGIIEVFVENGPEIKVDDLQVRIIGSRGIKTLSQILKAPLEKAVSAQLRFNYPADVGDVQQIKITPVLDQKPEPVFCSNQAVVSEDIKQC